MASRRFIGLIAQTVHVLPSQFIFQRERRRTIQTREIPGKITTIYCYQSQGSVNDVESKIPIIAKIV
jgi:hypothetical protein